MPDCHNFLLGKKFSTETFLKKGRLKLVFLAMNGIRERRQRCNADAAAVFGGSESWTSCQNQSLKYSSESLDFFPNLSKDKSIVLPE